MATTITYTPWVTGEIITANGLNGGKGGKYIIELDVNDYNETGGYIFELTMPDDFDITHFSDVIFHVPAYGSYEESYNIVQSATKDSNESEIWVLSSSDLNFHYDVETNKLYNETPDTSI